MFDRPKRARLLLALLIGASLLIVTIDYRSGGDGPLDSVGRGVMTVLGPLQEGLARIARPLGSFAAGFTQVPSLKRRIQTLENESHSLRSRLDQVSDIERENETFRQLLGLRERLDIRTKTAQVIGVGPSNFERTLFIDLGSKDGVRRGMPVLGGTGLVGRVVSTAVSSSEVLLIVDRSSAVAARLASRGETGMIQGTGGGMLRFELLDPEADVGVGDRVVTSAYQGGVYPPGIPVGSVERVVEARAPLSRVAIVRPSVDFATLDFVFLVTGGSAVRRHPVPSPTATPSSVR